MLNGNQDNFATKKSWILSYCNTWINELSQKIIIF